MAGVFALDGVTPLGVNVPILYLIPLLFAFLFDAVPARTVFTVVASVLTMIGASWEWKWNDVWLYGALNRAFDLGVFWIAHALSIRDARTTRELRDLRTALESSGIVSMTDINGVIRHVNDQFCAISKYSRDELIGSRHRIVNSEKHQSDVQAGLWHTIMAGRIWHGEVLNRAKDGAAYWVDATIVPFLDVHGKPYRFLAIEHDISEQKQADARTRSHEALSKISQMAAIVAHEVRNPIAGVRAGLQVLDRRSLFTPDERHVVGQMMERLDVLSAHVAALVHFAKPRSPVLGEVAIASLLNEIAHSLRDTCSAMQFEIQGLNLPVFGDPAMLREVFSQLLLNAADAQLRTGTIVVTVAEVGHAVDVRIADRGSGIPATLRDRVFEPLFTTKPGGAGLGLAMARQLVELHGGELSVVESSSSGTAVNVRLDRVMSRKPADAQLGTLAAV